MRIFCNMISITCKLIGSVLVDEQFIRILACCPHCLYGNGSIRGKLNVKTRRLTNIQNYRRFVRVSSLVIFCLGLNIGLCCTKLGRGTNSIWSLQKIL